MTGVSTLILFALTSIIGLKYAASPATAFGYGSESNSISIQMPDIRPDHKDQYLCMATRVPENRDGHYIVGINPKSNSSYVHHMLVYACRYPGLYQRDSPYFVWDCSSMHAPGSGDRAESTFEKGTVCAVGGEEQLMYGWAMDAPALQMPDQVGFKVGGDTGLNFLVLQVHYGHHGHFDRLPDLTDNSKLVLSTKPGGPDSGITKRAGILLLLSYGYVERGKSRHEIWCQIEEDVDIHPFRFRVHTHKLGTKVLGAKINGPKRRYSTDNDNDLTIGIGDPQQPQMFHKVREQNMTINRGDSVYAYCEFDNDQDRVVDIGLTGDDEMCNFYLMYWTSNPTLLKKYTCVQRNPSLARSLYNLLP